VLPPGYHAGYGIWQHTAAFKGKCYWAGSINYALWGRANRLCYDYLSQNPTGWDLDDSYYWSLENARGHATLWKHFAYHDYGTMTQQAEAFTTYGYNGTVPTLSLPCVPSGDVLPNQSLEWCWEPYKPRPK